LYHLSSQKVIALGVFLFIAATSFAQGNIEKHDRKRENNKYSYGIHLGFTQHNFRIEHSDSFLDQDDILGIEGTHEPGVAIGIIGALHPFSDLEIRAIPTLNFGNQNIVYYVSELEQPAEYKGESTVFELPLQLKYKSDPYKDFRMFVLGGGTYRNNFSANKNVEEDLNTVLLDKSDIAIEFGAGAEFHFPFFVLAPEITISQGLNNQIQQQNTPFSNSISSLNSRIYSFTINLE